jgi:ABC-type dipeptide/oligopeptide/nickel transport system permease component
MDMELLETLLAQSQSLLLVSILVSLGCAVLCGFIAARRKARWVWWSVMGFAFGPFAIPFVFLAKSHKPEEEKPS